MLGEKGMSHLEASRLQMTHVLVAFASSPTWCNRAQTSMKTRVHYVRRFGGIGLDLSDIIEHQM